jgi:hypothetical protein
MSSLTGCQCLNMMYERLGAFCVEEAGMQMSRRIQLRSIDVTIVTASITAIRLANTIAGQFEEEVLL